MHEHTPGTALLGQFAPEFLIPVLIISFLYLNRLTTNKKQRIFFFSGISSAILVINTPIGVRTMDYFSFHMIQHITLMMITGPLLVLGTPKTFRPTSKLFKSLTQPLFSWITYALLMIGVHLPGPHSFIMNNSWAHNYIEVPLYIIIPYLFYFNLLDRSLAKRRISPAMSVISLFLMMIPETLTGFFIYTAPNSLYEKMYTLNDQRIGGSLMWSGAMIIDTIWMSFSVYHWIKSEEKKSQDFDEQLAKKNE